MANRTAVLSALVVVLLATNGIVAYLHWGPGGDDPATDDGTDVRDGDQAGVDDGGEDTPNTGESTPPSDTGEEAPVWDRPVWPANTSWAYRLWTPNSEDDNQTVRLDVRGNMTVAGEPAYEVFRHADNQTVYFHRETLNRLADGTEQEIYEWPLEDGANWTIENETGRQANVTAEWVTNIVTPVGLFNGYKITAIYGDRGLIEEYYYVDSIRSYVRVDDYRFQDPRRGWERTLSLELIAYEKGQGGT
jgi:hypothetical protein